MTIAVFLDRDGTMNVEKGYIRNLDDLELIPGVAQAIKNLNDAGILAIMTTNQTGAARGFYDETHIQALNSRVELLLKEQAGAYLNAVFYCPHLEKSEIPQYAIACTCRKPEPGMIESAIQQFPGIEISKSYVLGDKATDVDFGYKVGAQSVLLKTGYGERVLAGKYQTLVNQPHFVCDDLPQAVTLILDKIRP